MVAELRPRGAIPSDRHKLARAPWAGHPDHGILSDVQPPAQFSTICVRYRYWGNNVDGCCVSTEEAAADDTLQTAAGKNPVVLISDQEVIDWARRHGFLNGAQLADVLDAMTVDGMRREDGSIHKDGPKYAVDYTSQPEVMAAIYKFKALKIAVAASQLQDVVGQSNGWMLLDGRHDSRIDHNVSLVGYGPLSYLCDVLKVPMPAGVKANLFCVAMFTWSTVGIVSWQSLQNIMIGGGEAWIRNPGDVADNPTPTPTPTPTPKPGPCPWFHPAARFLIEVGRLAQKHFGHLCLAGAILLGANSVEAARYCPSCQNGVCPTVTPLVIPPVPVTVETSVSVEVKTKIVKERRKPVRRFIAAVFGR